MKDINDSVTSDAFIDESSIEHSNHVNHALSLGGHYAAITTPYYMEISGRRYAGTKTPDSVRDLWSTHRDVVAYMEGRYGAYDLDAAASEDNKVCDKFYSQEINCLTRWWGKNKHVWLNPPYSNPDPFVLKVIEQMEHDNQIDLLLPADNSTAWFYDCVQNAAEIIWIIGDVEIIDDVQYSRSGRLAFISGLTGKPVDGNNKGSVIFVMRKLKEGEQQKTHYVKITDICPSVKNKRARIRSIK